MMPQKTKTKTKTTEIDWEKERQKSRAILKHLAAKYNWKDRKVNEMTPEEREKWAVSRLSGRVDLSKE